MSTYSQLEAKRALLRKKLQGIRNKLTIQPHPLPLKIYPLSYEQKRLWFIDQLAPRNPTYNLPVILKIQGQLHVEILNAALYEIISRHKILKTTFHHTNGTPFQKINDHVELCFSVDNLSELSNEQRNLASRTAINNESVTPFDLERGPLFRTKVLIMGKKEFIVLITFHHIITDGWSMKLFCEEINFFYKKLITGSSADLPKLQIQYHDYCIWQENKIHSHLNIYQEKVEKLKNKLADCDPLIDLPCDFPRSAVTNHQGALYQFLLPQNLVQQLKQFADMNHVTPFMVLLSVFVFLLTKYTNSSKVVLGVAATSRHYKELENLIGFFINPLIMIFDCFDNQFFINEYLKYIKDITLEAHDYHEIPFDVIVELLKIKRDVSFHPIFQVIFDYQYKQDYAINFNTDTHLEQNYNGTAKFDISLTFTEGNIDITGEIEYNTGLFNKETISNIEKHFINLLNQILHFPNRQLLDLSLITPSEEQQLLLKHNDTYVPFPTDKLLHQLFEEKSAYSPESIALIFENTTLSYGELNIRSNQLAHWLMACNIGPGTPIVVCLNRSFELIIAFLAIFKVGGIYVPVDPDIPQPRILQIINDSQAPLLLTSKDLSEHLVITNSLVVHLDNWSQFSEYSIKNPTSNVSLENAMYIIYTSGSTGQPKGVINLQKGALNHLLWMETIFKFTPTDAMCMKTSTAFDASICEIFLPLITGAKLVIIPPELHKDIFYLISAIQINRITTMLFTASQLELFLESSEASHCQSLKHIICGGEAISVKLCQKFYHTLNATLHNHYGMTEASDDSVYWQCTPNIHHHVPIGKPIANVQCFVLDSILRPVPYGIPGNLYIGGVGLARGYHNNPTLTAEKFIENPYKKLSPHFTDMIYMTGDMAKYDHDGLLIPLGRTDSQTKIRGFRVELEEIESLIQIYNNISESVVMVKKTLTGQLLIAYLVLHPGTEIDLGKLKLYLKNHLPNYMIPDHFIIINAMQKTTSGKINRKYLEAVEVTVDQKEMISPRNKTEQVLMDIWIEVLTLQNAISVYDDFFDIGGHSLLAAKLMILINEKLKIKLPLSVIIQNPNISSLASHVLSMKDNHSGTHPLIHLNYSHRDEKKQSKSPFIILPPLGGNVICYRDLAYRLSSLVLEKQNSYLPIYAFESLFLHDQYRVTSIANMSEIYADILQSTVPSDHYIITGWSYGGVLAAELAHQLRARSIKLIIIDCSADLVNAKMAASNTQDEKQLLKMYADYFNIDIDKKTSNHREALANIIKHGTTEELDTDSLVDNHKLLTVVKSHLKVIEHYSLPNINSDLLLFKSDHLKNCSTYLGWDNIVSGKIISHYIQGDHWSIVQGTSAGKLAQMINDYVFSEESSNTKV